MENYTKRIPMTYNEAVELSQEIQFKLNTMKCTNPECEKTEKRVGRMCSIPVSVNATLSLGEELSFTDKICCDQFREELQNKYQEHKEALV